MPVSWRKESEYKHYVEIPRDRDGNISLNKFHIKDYDKVESNKNVVLYVRKLEEEIDNLKCSNSTAKYYYAIVKVNLSHPLLRCTYGLVVFCPINANEIHIYNGYVGLQERDDAKHLTFDKNHIYISESEVEKVTKKMKDWESEGIIVYSQDLFNLAKDMYAQLLKEKGL